LALIDSFVFLLRSGRLLVGRLPYQPNRRLEALTAVQLLMAFMESLDSGFDLIRPSMVSLGFAPISP
jgi:hypothetical protein